MDARVLFAVKNDEEELREILLEYGMDISGEIEDHLIVKKDNDVLAGGKIIEFEEKHFFLEVIGVKDGYRDQGYGGILLSEIVRNPWMSSKHLLTEPKSKESFRMTTVARGEAVDFYKKYSFVPCDFDTIPWPYREQCIDCPDKDNCNPVPMILCSEVNE